MSLTNEELLDHFVTTWDEMNYGKRGAEGDYEKANAAVLTRMSPGWQPIETAPRNETDVLLLEVSNGRHRTPIVAGWFEKFTDCPGWYSENDPDNIIDIVPTYWMPLLKPPL